MPPIAAESIGLAIHELTTGALKYGALKSLAHRRIAPRRAGDLDLKGQQVTLHDPIALARSVGRSPTRISAADADEDSGLG